MHADRQMCMQTYRCARRQTEVQVYIQIEMIQMCVWTYRCACRHTGVCGDIKMCINIQVCVWIYRCGCRRRYRCEWGADADADMSAQTDRAVDPHVQVIQIRRRQMRVNRHRRQRRRTGDTEAQAHVSTATSFLPPCQLSKENRVSTSPEPSKSLLHLTLPV